MTNALSPIGQSEARVPAIRGGIPPAEKRTAAMIGYLHNNLETIPGSFHRYALSAACEPSAEQKDLLLARRQEIDAGLDGCDELTIREHVGILRSSMATAPLGEEAMKLAKRGFILVLGKYPTWAVVEAAMRFLDGRAGNKTYAPTAAEMAEVCRGLISQDLAERARINAILDAEVYHQPSEEDRAAIAARHAEFVAQTAARARMPTKPAPEPPKPYRDPRAMEELAARTARRQAEERAEAAATPEASQTEDAA